MAGPEGQAGTQPKRTVSVDAEGNISGLEEVLKSSGFGTDEPPPEGEPEKTDPEPEPEPAPVAEKPPATTKKLKWQGQEMELPEEEVISLAQKGFDYQKKTQALAEKERSLAPVEGIYRQLQTDPQFARHIVDYLQGPRPQPQQAPEPTDPIEKLKAEIKAEMRQEIMPAIDHAIMPQRQQLVINQVRQELMVDPMYRDVHEGIVNYVKAMPETIARTVWLQLDQDPDAYVKTYHAIREKMAQAKNAQPEGSPAPKPGAMPKPVEKKERAPILESAGTEAPIETVSKKVKIDKLKAQALRSGDSNALAGWLLEGGFLDQLK